MSEKGNPWASPEAAAWRDMKGRFLPGNPGGPGNPHAREMARLRAQWRMMTTDCVFESLHGRLLGKALAGSLPALRLFLEYMMGKPDRTVDIDELDHHEIALEVRRRRAEDEALKAGVDMVPALPPGPLPAFPPPAGRPEAEWRRVRRQPGRAAPPPDGRVPPRLAAWLQGMYEGGATVEQLRAWTQGGGADDARPVANGQAGGRLQTGDTGGVREGAPGGAAAGERR